MSYVIVSNGNNSMKNTILHEIIHSITEDNSHSNIPGDIMYPTGGENIGQKTQKKIFTSIVTLN